MFTGIVEELGLVHKVEKEHSNLNISIGAKFAPELKIDQSIAHNGACLTVVEIKNSFYTVTAIEETLMKTNLGDLKRGDRVNLERCMQLGERIDGHLVQGHIDQTAVLTTVEEKNGSHIFRFSYDQDRNNLTVEKGSVCINGVSLTVVESFADGFSVAIIPYTYENTNFHLLKPGDKVNLEFDIIGKYVRRYLMQMNTNQGQG